jgi:tape measure domain-containing protein
MAKLYFKVGADYDKVIRLRDEIKKLENQLKSFGTSTPNAEIKRTEERLASSRQEFTRLATEAAKAGAVMKDGLKKKIDSVTKSSDELSAEIIKQRAIIRETKEDVRMLSEQYSKLGKYSPQSAALLARLNKAKAALNEQKYALGELQGQQASNRLEIRQLTRQYREFSEETDKSTVAVDALMSSLKRTAAEIGGLAAIKKFGTDVIDATGKMQQLQVALSTILQSKSKADALLAEVTEFARKTPFNLDDVANGAKQLLAYGSSAETVVDELSMLGDVASGLQIPLSSLIYLYGTLRVQGRAYWRDIQQFQGRGVNVVEEMAKNLGVTQDQIKKLVEEGKIGFKDVEKAFQSMTSEGGKFNNMLENAAGTWPQRIANLEDTLFTKLVDFGNKYKEVFEFGIGTAEELVEHLDDVISVIGGLIAAYGTYRAALIVTAVAQKAVGFVDSIRLIMAYRKEMGLATAAQQAFNLAAKSNVYVALLSVLVGLGTAVYMFTKRTNEATASQEALSKVSKKADEEFSSQAATIDRLNGVLRSETASLDQKKKALGELQSIIPDYNASLNEEGKLINNNTEAIKAYLVQLEKQIKLKAAQEELEELYRSKRLQEKNVQKQQANYDRTRKQNPIGVVYGGDAGIEAQRLSLNRIAKAEKSLKDANDELKDTQTQIASIEKEIEQVSLASSKAQKPTSSLSSEIKNASEKIRNLKKEISGLRSGNIKAEAGKTVESTIEAKNKELQAAEKTLETLTGKSNKTTAKAENQRKKAAEQQKKAQEELNKSLLSLQQQNQDDEIALMRDGTEKKLAEIDNDYKKRIAEIERQEAEFKEKNKEAGITGLGVNGLTKEQQNALQEAADNAAKERERQTNEVYAAEAQAMRDYLKQYGTFQQQKLAIAEEYAEKIRNAQSEGERLSLEKEREQAVANVNLSAIRQDVDWAGVFSEFGTMFQDEIERNLDALRDIMKSDEFKAMRPTDQAQIVEAVDSLREQVTGDLKDVDFKKIGELTVEFQNAQRKMIAAQAAEAVAYGNLEKAQADYEQALRNGTAEEQAAAKQRLDMARTTADSMSAAYKGAVGEFNATGNNLKDATDNAVDAINSISSAISQIKSGSLSGAFEGVKNLSGTLGKSLSNMSGLLGKAGNALSNFSSTLGGATGEIAGAVLGLLDLLKDGIGSMFADLSDIVFNAVNSILDDIFSGGIITKPLESVVKGAGNILNTISFGGFNSLLGIGSNAKEVQEAIDRLTDRNESLQQSIDDLKDTIQDASGAQSVEAARKAEEYQREQNENYLQIAREQARYSGAHHSWNYYWNGFSDEQIKKFSEQIGRSWNGDIFDLSPEEMKLLRGNIDMWEKIQNTGKGDYGGRLTDKLDDYIDQAGKLEEITNTLNETLTQISFDSLYDSFIDMLMDMDASAEDFADDFSGYMMRALLSNQVGTMFKDRLQEWYTAFAEAMEDGDLASGELDSLRDEWDKIVADAMAERDKLAAATGYDNTSSSSGQQSASSKGFETMSQDEGEELNGRMTAIYEAELNIANTTTEQLAVLRAIYGQMGGNIADVASESKQIMSTSYIQQNNISFPTAQLDALVAKVEGLDTKVADLVAFGVDNRLSMQALEENTTLTAKNSKHLPALKDIRQNTQKL